MHHHSTVAAAVKGTAADHLLILVVWAASTIIITTCIDRRPSIVRSKREDEVGSYFAKGPSDYNLVDFPHQLGQ